MMRPTIIARSLDWFYLLVSLLPIIVVAILAILIASPATRNRAGTVTMGNNTFVWDDGQHRWMLLMSAHDKSSTHNAPVRSSGCVWPEDNCAGQDDRIIDQLLLPLPEEGQQVIKIFPAHAMGRHFNPEAETQAEEENLPHNDDCLSARRCKLSYNLDQADVVIFPNADVVNEPARRRRKDQIWIAYLLESPQNTFPERYQRLYRGRHEFNWTASYRRNSDIVTPYAKFVPYQSSPSLQQPNRSPLIDISAHKELIRGKRKKVAWFVSNCCTANKRLEYARELSKYIQVDIYGKCGSLNCDKWNQTSCFEMLNRDYKFYLSFENSNSDDYITEKLFQNALGDNDHNYLLLPIVMGPSRANYERLAPPNSFIHVEDNFDSGGGDGSKSNIKKLADYLKMLDSNDALYYSYFSWKTMGRFVDTKFMCRVCLLAHETVKSGRTKIYSDLKEWFRRSEQ